MKNHNYYVYMLTNRYHTVIYTGVTNDLKRSVLEHRQKVNVNSFTAKYNVNKLVYYEHFTVVTYAIDREK